MGVEGCSQSGSVIASEILHVLIQGKCVLGLTTACGQLCCLCKVRIFSIVSLKSIHTPSLYVLL